MRRRLAAVAVLVLAAGCGGPKQRGPVAIADDRVPFDLLQDELPATTTTTTPAGDPVRLCLVGPDGFLHELSDHVDLDAGPKGVIRALTKAPGELTTALPAPAPVAGVTVAAGVATVDLTDAFGQLGTTPQHLAIAQIVCTLTSLPGVGQVRFTLSGSPIDVPDGTGALLPGPVSRDDYTAVIAP